ncbi:hypothetical protein KQI65_03630 [bacterium]|nr:hypothetical protein [bacterium]
MSTPLKKHPPLFHRVLLAQLFLLLLSFVTVVVLLDYLFVEGLSLYIQRSPIILVPVVLALIGFAGLGALWASGSSSVPLDRITSLLDRDTDAESVLAELEDARTEENAALVKALHGHLKRNAHRYRARPFYFQIDAHLNIHATDADTAARLGSVPGEISRQNLLDVLSADTEDAATLRAALHAAEEPGEIDLHFIGPANRPIIARAQLHRLPGDRWLLLGNDIRRG